MTLKRVHCWGAALALALGGLGAAAYAEGTAPVVKRAGTPPPKAASAPVAVEPDAMAALQNMGKYLRTLKAFQVQATTSKEDVLDDGQKVTVGGEVNLLAEVPNHLRMEVASYMKERTFLYDGKTFTLFSPLNEFYASISAPPTINKLADLLEDKYAIDLPLVDLFRWGASGETLPKITGATNMGPSQIGGTTCEHYLFRQEGVDWQIWIQSGDFPLPRKIVITDLTDEARPQYTAVYTWNLAPSYNEAAFTFEPAPTAKKIVFSADRTIARPAKGK